MRESVKFVYPKVQILIIDNYSRHKQLKEQLIKGLENYQDVQNRETNVKATMTEWNISTSEIEKLKCKILSHCSPMLWDNPRCKINDFWANIYRKGDYTLSHRHLSDHIAAVYFLKSKRYYSPLCFESFGFEKRIAPKEGRLVIFPAYLRHRVPKHKHKDTRITLACNISGTLYKGNPMKWRVEK